MHRLAFALWSCALAACSSHAPGHGAGGAIVIDRFDKRAGHLLVRDERPDLPGPGQPIDFDRPPFLTQGLGPDGIPVRYYNFDVQRDTPALLYRFTHAGTHEPIAGQHDVVDMLPGDAAYSDFWQIAWVEVPGSFTPGSITSARQIGALPVTRSTTVVDCPIVPRGSTAREGRGVAPAQLTELWYRGQAVSCLLFAGELTLDAGKVPTSPIYVTFASEAGPASGFRTEPRTPQTHNVVMSVPGDVDYSPLWAVHIYDRGKFDRVHDANSALAAGPAQQGPLVNCPIVALLRP
jgi:hypothetical protein